VPGCKRLGFGKVSERSKATRAAAGGVGPTTPIVVLFPTCVCVCVGGGGGEIERVCEKNFFILGKSRTLLEKPAFG
jgi:hypothetical protein